jgi:hypothetical protein
LTVGLVFAGVGGFSFLGGVDDGLTPTETPPVWIAGIGH